MAAIEASSVGIRTMADGTLRLSVDIEPRNAQAAFRLFGAPGTAIALAALKPKNQAHDQADVQKGGTAARWLGMRCAEPAFQEWLIATFGAPAGTYASGAERAASLVRSVCSVASRAEIDNDARANAAFQRLIRGPWKHHAEQLGIQPH